MSVNSPEPAYFWDSATGSWVKAVSGQAGEYVWNPSLNAWEKGTIGAEYLWNDTTKSWDMGPGGKYVWDSTSKTFIPNTNQGGGRYYWDSTSKTFVLNTGFAAETQSFLSRISSAPSETRKRVINTLITALKSAGVWNKLDTLYVFAAADAQSALLNWKSSSYGASAVNTPTFTTDRGYVSNGTTSYLDTGFIPSTNGVNFAQNSASIGVWIRSTQSDVAAPLIAAGASDPTKSAILAAWRSVVGIGTQLNDLTSGTVGSGIATRIGLSVLDRSAGTREAYRNGASIGTDSVTSVGLPTVAAYVCCRNNNGTASGFTTDQISAHFMGSHLTAAEHLALYNALSAYMTAVGA